jgi:hypothetical protein
MNTKFLALVSVLGLAACCVVQAQSPAPAESPAASPAKHRTHKKAEATAQAAGTEASPSPTAKHGRKAKTTTEASPPPAGAAVSASPVAKAGRKTKTAAAAAPAVSPSPSPAKKTLADLFKPQTSASPAAANAAPARATGASATMNATAAPGGGHGLVWVNSDSHVYHKEGSRFYGKTKKGKYVSEADAIKEGDKPAKRE